MTVKVEIKPDYETVLIDTIASLADALKRKNEFADDFARRLTEAEGRYATSTNENSNLQDKVRRLNKDHGDNLATYNERGVEIARLKHENQSLKDRLDIALGKLRELRRRKR